MVSGNMFSGKAASSGAQWQAALWDGPSSLNRGGEAAQTACANGQRGVNRQPSGMRSMVGTMPPMVVSLPVRAPTEGTELISPIV
jgi:hypothetical protein